MTAIAHPEQTSNVDVDSQNPWPGLVAFTESLRDYFYGRVDEAEDLLRRVNRKNLTILFGQSGLGKSSLLQAGLFPRLRAEGYLPVPIRLDHATAAPSLADQVEIAASRAIAEAGARPRTTPPDHTDTLWEFLHRRGLILETDDGSPIRPVLVFDQFEELFAIGQASEETRRRAADFLTELADFVENRAPEALERRLDDSPELVKQFIFDNRGYRILVSLREDYLPPLESLRQSMPSIAENRMRLTRMNGMRALEAVSNPGGRLITCEVGRQVVRFVAGARSRQADEANVEPEDDGLAQLELEPSLLSLVCRELNNRRLSLGLSQITADLLAGNRERILQDFYERCVTDQPPAVRAFVEDELVTDSGLRENIALERARKALTQRGAPASAIDDLVKRRLLHLEERLDIQRVELTHDVLTQVVKKSRDERQQKEAMLRAEETADEAREKARRQRKRLGLTIAGMAAALVLVSGFGLWSYSLYRVSQERLLEVERQKHEADRQKDRAEKGEDEARNARREAEVVKEVFDQSSMPVSEENIRHFPGLSPVHEELANIRLKSIELLAKKSPDDPSTEPKVARAHVILGMISTNVGSFHRAEEHLTKAVELYGQLARKPTGILEHRLGECRAWLELGWLRWSDNREMSARRCYEQALERLEDEYTRSPNSPAVSYELGMCLIRLGSVLPNAASKETREKLATRAIRVFEQLTEQGYRETDARAGLAMAKYRLVWSRFDSKDQQGLINSLSEITAVNDAARKLEPASPYLNSFAVFAHHDNADALVALGKVKEALVEREAAVAKAREIAKHSPDLSRYNAVLAGALDKLGLDLKRLKRHPDAQATFEESIQLFDGLVRRFPDWGDLAYQWIDVRNDLSDLFEYGLKPQGEIQAKQDLLRTLDQTIRRGREFTARFPDQHWVQVSFAKALDSRGRYDLSADRKEQALPYYLEAAEVYRKRVLPDEDSSGEDDVTTYLSQLQSAADCANSLGKNDEVIWLSQLATHVLKRCSTRAGADDLGRVLFWAAKVHSGAGRYKEAIQAYQQAIEVRRAALEKAPWHWYLESGLGGSYMELANVYRETRDFRNEVLANREYLRIIIGPRYGAKIDEDIRPSRPADEAEANRIRELIKTATATGMKRFTVPCDFDGIKYPFFVYVTNVPYPKHPLEDQARWLREERGGIIPQEVMDSFQRLQKIAHENKVSFVELCVYALGTAAADDTKKLEIENVGDSSTGAATPDTPGNLARDPLADMTARLVDLKAKLDSAPGDLSTIREAAQAYEEYGQRRLKAKQPREGVEALRESVRLRQWLARSEPTEMPRRALLATTLNWLAKAFVQLKDFDSAYNCFHRRLDLLEQLQIEAPSSDQKPAIAECHILLGELAEVRGDRTEAMRWYARANKEKNGHAPRKIATLLQVAPELSALLSEEVQAICVRMKAAGKSTSAPKFVEDFCAEVEKSQKDAIRTQGNQEMAQVHESIVFYHDLAQAYAVKGRRGDYRKILGKEFDARGQEVQLNPTDWQLKNAQANVAAELAQSYLGSKEASLAIAWTTRAADLGDTDSQLQLSDWYEKGTMVTADVKKANHYGYLGHYGRGVKSLNGGRYEDALADLRKVCASHDADADDHDKLGQCCGKLGRWDEAIAAYSRSVELDLKSAQATRVMLRLLEALLIAEHPERMLEVVQSIEKKRWKLPTDGIPVNEYGALFHAFRAIALRMSGKDAAEAERLMLQLTEKPDFKTANWTSDELDKWLKTTKLAPNTKAPVERILHELKRTPESLLHLADWYEKGIDGKLDVKKANHYRYLGHYNLGIRLFRQRRYADALPDLKNACDSAEADADDHDTLAMCYGKLGRWDDAIRSYTRSIELDLKSEGATGVVVNLLEALTCAERPEQLLQFVESIKLKGWELPRAGAEAAKYSALFHGFRAIALMISGKDASEAEKAMRQFTGKPDFKVTNWSWDELNNWLKTTKLAADRKAAVEKVIAELERTETR
jgi:tetratricopeptide (TPR) repeat protein